MSKPIEFVVAIPARFGSTRLPGKPLRVIGGRSMIARVVERAVQAGASAVVVATDDARIVAALHGSPARVLLTRADHRSGSDRLAEVADLCAWSDATVVINLQGDEPFAPPAGIRAVAELLLRADTPMATLCTPIDSAELLFSPDTVKVIGDANGRAVYFSRAPIPFARDAFAAASGELPAGVRYLRHIGIYAYRAGFLRRFALLPPSALERIEALEQLRAIEAGVPIALAETPVAFPPGVDTEADLQRAVQMTEDR